MKAVRSRMGRGAMRATKAMNKKKSKGKSKGKKRKY
jgi:hypothetical protein